MKFDVELSNVHFSYKNFEALSDISFTLEPGKTYGLLGRNGAGKTTLLSLLASFQLPSQGSISIAGEDPYENPRIMPHITFLYDSDFSEDDSTAQEYFQFGKRYRPNFDLDYALKLADKFEVPLDKLTNELSSGKQSSLNAILGLASLAPITIFDETYLGMDAPTRQLFYNELIDTQEQHPRIMILSTHLVSEMEYLFDHVLIIDQGKLLADQPYDELINRGVSITGIATDVDQFSKGKDIINAKQLGNTKSVMIFGQLSDTDITKAQNLELEIGTVALQDLFIHLTGGIGNDRK